MHAKAGLLLRIGQIGLFYLMLLWLGAMLLLGNIACVPLVVVPKRFREPLMQRLISGLFRLFLLGATRSGLMQLDLGALDRLNEQRSMLLVANHPSMIDVFLVISRVRRSICIMKANIGTNLLLAIGAYLAGYVSNRHTDAMLRSAAMAVEQGNLLLVFPEGTRTTRQPVNDIKPGVALIAKRSNAPLQVIVIVTNSAYLSKGWKIYRPPQFPLIYKATLGERLFATNSVTDTASRLQACFEQAINCSIDPSLRV
jgi:1-acyl-sn-glycerol-3-phosphate acyltransferase